MKRQNIIFSVAVLLLMGSCAEQSDMRQTNINKDVPLTLTASGGTAPAMRAATNLYQASTGFDGNEQVKVYMDDYAGNIKSALFDVGTPYTSGSLMMSDLTLHSGEGTIHYPTWPEGTLGLYSIYPATSTATHTVSYDQTSDAGYKQSDLMYAAIPVSWTTLEEKYALKPNLSFRHQLVKLKVTILKYPNISRLQEVKLHNVKRTVSVSTPTETGMTLGDVTSATDGNGDAILISSGETASGELVTYEYACVFPAQEWKCDDGNVVDFLTVKADDGESIYQLQKEFLGGYEYSLVINLNGTMLNTTSTISDWTGTDGCVVNEAKIEGGTLTVASVADQAYTGSSFTPAPTVKLGGTTLTKDTHYALQYFNNTNPGQALIVAVGKTGTDYEGMIGLTSFNILALDLAQATIAGIDAVTYNRAEQRPEPTVTNKGKVLVKGTDFDYSYSNNTDAGTATVTITGIDGGGYSGTKSQTFIINQKNMSSNDVTLTLSATNYVYDGTEKSVTYTVTDTNNGATATLSSGGEYTASGTTSATSVGTYTVTVTGKGNYTGTKTATWQIAKAPSSVTTAPTAKTGLTYNGSAQTLVNGGTASGGTMYYASTTTNSKPAKSALTSTGVPSQTNAGTYYVWYYVKGDNSHTDTEVLGPVAVTIKKKTVSDWSISPTTMSLEKGNSGTITVNYGVGSSSDHGTVSYSSSAPANATVSSGTVKAVAAGSATITVTIADGTNYTYSGSKTCAVTVTQTVVHQRGDIIQDPDYSGCIKVYTSPTTGYRIQKTDESGTYNAFKRQTTWGSSYQWEEIFGVCGNRFGGFSTLNTAVTNASPAISDWVAMSEYYWTNTPCDGSEYTAGEAYYFRENRSYFGSSGTILGGGNKLKVRRIWTFTDK